MMPPNNSGISSAIVGLSAILQKICDKRTRCPNCSPNPGTSHGRAFLNHANTPQGSGNSLFTKNRGPGTILNDDKPRAYVDPSYQVIRVADGNFVRASRARGPVAAN